MKVYNQNKTEILETYDLEKGYLKDDTVFVAHHDAVEGVEGAYHYETVKEYPNGGKEVKKVWDIEPVKAQEAYDEYEDIKIYISYTEAELVAIRAKKYPALVERYIREKYSLSAELAALRQRAAKPEEFAAYDAYAESAKERARAELGILEVEI